MELYGYGWCVSIQAVEKLMRIQDFLMGILVIGLVTTATLYFVLDLNVQFGTSLDNETVGFLQAIDGNSGNTSEVYQLTEQLRGKAPGGENVSISTGGAADTFETRLGESGIRAIAGIPGAAFSSVTAIFKTVQKYTGVPAFVTGTFMAMIILIITIALISSVLKNRL